MDNLPNHAHVIYEHSHHAHVIYEHSPIFINIEIFDIGTYLLSGPLGMITSANFLVGIQNSSKAGLT